MRIRFGPKSSSASVRLATATICSSVVTKWFGRRARTCTAGTGFPANERTASRIACCRLPSPSHETARYVSASLSYWTSDVHSRNSCTCAWLHALPEARTRPWISSSVRDLSFRVCSNCSASRGVIAAAPDFQRDRLVYAHGLRRTRARGLFRVRYGGAPGDGAVRGGVPEGGALDSG